MVFIFIDPINWTRISRSAVIVPVYSAEAIYSLGNQHKHLGTYSISVFITRLFSQLRLVLMLVVHLMAGTLASWASLLCNYYKLVTSHSPASVALTTRNHRSSGQLLRVILSKPRHSAIIIKAHSIIVMREFGGSITQRVFVRGVPFRSE